MPAGCMASSPAATAGARPPRTGGGFRGWPAACVPTPGRSARAGNLVHGSDQQGCSPGCPAVMIPIMCLRFVFLLVTRVAAGLRLSRREEMWKTAEILILRHQLSVLQRRQPRRPKLNWAGPGTARYPARRHTESAAPRTAAADYPGNDRALAPRHRLPPLGRPVRVPEPVNLDLYRVRKHAHAGGMINEYRLVA
jgi:hypothetical protein